MNTRNLITFFAVALVIGFATTVSIPNSILAASNGKKFDKNLSYGIKNSAEVKSLQLFLSQEGYFKGEATGNYFNVTLEAVKAFQKSHKINPTGYFGPLTQAAVNSKSVDALLSLTSHKGGETIEVGNTQTLKWTSANYISSDVTVNIIKKVSSNPNRYELVRTVSDKTLNDGSATWVPARTDIGNNIFVEVGCKDSKVACRAAITSSSLAVINSNKYSNTASAFDALERADNK